MDDSSAAVVREESWKAFLEHDIFARILTYVRKKRGSKSYACKEGMKDVQY
jgi:hypothetical protein